MSTLIACRTGTSLSNHASIIGLSVALAVGLLGLSPRSAMAATFTPVIDEFQIIKNNDPTQFSFFDSFNGGGVPPQGPGSDPTPYTVTGGAGMTSESGGKLTMTPSLGAPTSGLSASETITRATRTTSTAPASDNGGLGLADTFKVRGRFDISLPNTLPTINGQSFGIRLQDQAQDFPNSNDIVQLNVIRRATGELAVRFAEIDLQAGTNLTAGIENIVIPVGAIYIELFLEKAANSANPTASFNFLDAAFNSILISNVGLDNELPNGQLIALFEGGEGFTRAGFFSTDAVPLPGALPLFATILAGSGLMAWRRRRKAAQQHA